MRRKRVGLQAMAGIPPLPKQMIPDRLIGYCIKPLRKPLTLVEKAKPDSILIADGGVPGGFDKDDH